MRIQIEIDENLASDEVVIKVAQFDEKISQLEQYFKPSSEMSLSFIKDNSEYFLDLEMILYFETEGSKVLAHSLEDVFEVKLKLYQLEETLPSYFCRISKSAIANTRKIYALDKSFSGTSLIRFFDSQKIVYVSRHYYKTLKESLKGGRR